MSLKKRKHNAIWTKWTKLFPKISCFWEMVLVCESELSQTFRTSNIHRKLKSIKIKTTQIWSRNNRTNFLIFGAICTIMEKLWKIVWKTGPYWRSKITKISNQDYSNLSLIGNSIRKTGPIRPIKNMNGNVNMVNLDLLHRNNESNWWVSGNLENKIWKSKKVHWKSLS